MRPHSPILVVGLMAFGLVVAGCQREASVTPGPAAIDRAPPTASKRAPLTIEPPAAEDLDPDPTVLKVSFNATVQMLLVDGPPVLGFAYNQQVPGPTLRARVGDTFELALSNQLDDPTTIHWHGVHVPFAMDGVTWQQDPIQPGETFTYTFQLTHPGTYWYHPHFNTSQQVDRGLYGALIVEDPADPKPDTDVVLLFDDWNEYTGGHDGGHDHGAHRAIARRWTVNGQTQPTITLQGGTWARVRLVNVSNSAYLELQWPNLVLIGGDQGLLPAAQTPSSVVLTPGDRADAVWLVGEKGFTVRSLPHTLMGGSTYGEVLDVVTVAVDAPAPAPQMPDFPFPDKTPSPDPKRADIVYVFSGSDHTGEWRINGEKFPDVTVETVPLGAEVIVEVRNLSPTEHPFHLHGMPFEVLSRNDVPVPYYQLEDTINVRIRETVRVRVMADNPGDWMAHCHILPHAGGGMMTVLRVQATP